MKGFIFTYFLSYGGSVVALFNPFIGLCIYYCYVVLRPQDLWFYSLPQGASYSRYVALATLVGWGLQGFSGREGLRVASPVLFTFAGFVLVVQISAWFALNPSPCRTHCLGFIETLSHVSGWPVPSQLTFAAPSLNLGFYPFSRVSCP